MPVYPGNRRACCGPVSWPSLWLSFTDFPPVAPFYWDVQSAEERIKVLCDYLWKTIHFTEGVAEDVDSWSQAIDALQKEFEEFKANGFEDYYREQVKEWIGENTKYLFDTLARQVYFGLNLEGYFVAFIPQSWDEIVFDTGHDYTKDTYGRLILRWEADPSARSTFDQRVEDARR